MSFKGACACINSTTHEVVGSSMNEELIGLLTDSQCAASFDENMWGRVLKQAKACRLELLLAEKCAGALPEFIGAQLSNETMALTLENMARCRELLQVLTHLKSRGLFTLAYKGPTLSLLAHGSPTLRSFDDLDLWVPPSQYQATAETLLEMGYDHATQPLPRCHLLQAFETTLVHPNRRVSIDLHRSFLPPATPLNDAELVSHLQEISLLGEKVMTLSNEALLVLLLAHGCKHAWREFRWIYDVHCLIANQNIDWVKVYELSLDSDCYLACQVGLLLAQKLLQTGHISELFWPNTKTESLANISLGYLSKGRPKLRQLQAYDWSLCTTLRSRSRYLFHTLVAPHELDLAWIDLPPNLYWLYYLLRPIRKAGSLLRR